MKSFQQKEQTNSNEAIIGFLLRVLVILSASFVFTGGILYLFENGGTIPNYKVFQGEPPYLKNVYQIIGDAFNFHSRGLIQLGIVLLIANPVARVIFAAASFIYEKDYMYLLFSVIVISVLLFSFLG
jgi:uncharacterized membrane protein